MSVTDFVTDRLKMFLKSFPMAKVKYGIDRLANVHTIEVFPSSVLDREDVFSWVDGFITDTINHYPNDLICVCPPDDNLGVGELQFEEKGLEFNPISTFTPLTNEISAPLGLFTKFVLSQAFQYPDKLAVTSLIEPSNDYSLAA